MDHVSVSQRLQPHINTLNNMGVKRLAVFGSVARNSASDSSDLDMLVRFKKNKKTFDNFMELKFFLQEIFPEVRIDLVLEDSLKETIRNRILSEARDVA
ncbi:MAG: nucleotidyltransferase family protein [Spirochaetales bacterium]|nr:nucleotidyltransferase family protein [Spirochaetales bacterium]MCF7939199.1 nucleotidyltransferase family protein [Spirochaetales bacterium]